MNLSPATPLRSSASSRKNGSPAGSPCRMTPHQSARAGLPAFACSSRLSWSLNSELH